MATHTHHSQKSNKANLEFIFLKSLYLTECVHRRYKCIYKYLCICVGQGKYFKTNYCDVEQGGWGREECNFEMH